jgi:hypothetical protein
MKITNKSGYIIGCAGGYLTYIYKDYHVDNLEIGSIASEAKIFDYREEAQTTVNCLTLKNGDREFKLLRYKSTESIEEIL